jgi:hypothetical protein
MVEHDSPIKSKYQTIPILVPEIDKHGGCPTLGVIHLPAQHKHGPKPVRTVIRVDIERTGDIPRHRRVTDPLNR